MIDNTNAAMVPPADTYTTMRPRATPSRLLLLLATSAAACGGMEILVPPTMAANPLRNATVIVGVANLPRNPAALWSVACARHTSAMPPCRTLDVHGRATTPSLACPPTPLPSSGPSP